MAATYSGPSALARLDVEIRGRICDAVSMIAAIRATPMIRNAAGTMIANPHATAPVAASATDGRPWGTNDVTIGVARHSQAISNPTTTRRTEVKAERATAKRSDRVIWELPARICMAASSGSRAASASDPMG